METKKFTTRPTKSKQSVGVTFQVTPEFRKELQYYADLDERPLGQFIKLVMKNYMKKLEIEK